VTLPAEACDKCGYNFRLGNRPGPSPSAPLPGSAGPGSSPPGSSQAAPPALGQEGTGRKKYLIAGAAVAALIIIVIVLALSGGPEPPPAPEAAPQGSGGSILAPPPSALDSPLLHPERPIGAAQRAADAANQNRQRLEEAADGSDGLPPEEQEGR
jgi:hypothetical protein